jgi:toxin-antitoxin system PIN domain toxin
MVLSDVNVLVHAFRTDSSDHVRCRDWLFRVVDSDSRFGMAPQALAALVRLVTNPRIFREPTAPDVVLGFCARLLGHPNCVAVLPGNRHWPIFHRLCLEANARGNLVSDAWFAALAIEWACEWVTLDRDFARFAGLRWTVP